VADKQLYELTSKAVPVAADILVINDSESANATRRVTVGALPVDVAQLVGDIPLSQVDVAGSPNTAALTTTKLASESGNHVLVSGLPIAPGQLSAAVPATGIDIAGATGATPVLADSVLIYDASAGANRKATLTDIATLSNRGYGQIYGCPASPVTINLTTSYAAIPTTLYTADGPASSAVSVSFSTGRITINATGIFKFTFSCLARRASLITGVDFALHKVAGDVEYPAVRQCGSRFSADSQPFTLVGLVSVTSGDVFEMRVRRTTGANTMESESVTLVAAQVG